MVKEMSNFERSQEHSVNSLTFSLVENLLFLWKAYDASPVHVCVDVWYKQKQLGRKQDGR